MAVIKISQKTEFEDTISSNDLVVVHFYADWATQCGPMNDVLEELAKQVELKAVRFATCPAEDLPEVSLKYSISAVPTFLLLRGGSLLDRVDGANAAELTKKINLQLYINGELIGGLDIVKEMNESGELQALLPKKAPLETRLKSLINQSTCMVFMKGSRDAPLCGFSKQLMAILAETDIKFDTFDILTDEEVRQGLKTFSNWPTYPQVYVKGELVGGLDIIKELKENGELLSTLKGDA